jgi:MFS family permease
MTAARPEGEASFLRFWSAAAVSAFGTAVTTVALPVLVVQVLGATPVEVGIVNAAQLVPYALLGLLAGVYVDRWPRARVLVWASAGRGVVLGLIPVLWLSGVLEIWSLVVLLLLFGTLMVLGFAASQSLLPQLVTRSRLLVANSRLDQTDAAAQTAGPAIGGGLVGLLGAPAAIALDAVSYLVEAVVVARLRVSHERSALQRRERRGIGRDIAEGLRWTYRHRVLAPLALSTHVWFIANAGAFTVLAIYALRDLALSPVVYGGLFAAAGVATLTGATLSPRWGRTFGAGRTIALARAVYPFAWLIVAVLALREARGAVAMAALFAALVLQGLAAGIENAHEMAYRQAAAPEAVLGRVNATMRSANRTMAAVGALLAGVGVTLVGSGAAFVAAVAVFTIAAAIAAFSPLRHARHEEVDDDPQPGE